MMLNINRFKDFKIQIMLAGCWILMLLDPKSAPIPLLLLGDRLLITLTRSLIINLHQTCRLFTRIWSNFMKPFSLTVLCYTNITGRTPWCYSCSLIWSSCIASVKEFEADKLTLIFFHLLSSSLKYLRWEVLFILHLGYFHQNIPLDFLFNWKIWPGRNRRTQTDADLQRQAQLVEFTAIKSSWIKEKAQETQLRSLPAVHHDPKAVLQLRMFQCAVTGRRGWRLASCVTFCSCS